MDATIHPEGSLEVLSKHEVAQLLDSGQGGLYELWRRCSLAVLNCGSEEDDTREILRRNKNFSIDLVQQDRGVKLALKDAPSLAFVDGRMIKGIREQLFAVLRDLIFVHNELGDKTRFDLTSSQGITNAVFHILRNAGVLESGRAPDMVVCWGGHAIGRLEYDYTKEVGYELGLRHLSVCTGCGAGAMKGPMKGANIGHAKQRIGPGRYLGVTEPTIIAAEAPNPIVNELVIMPDMEKRLEAFVRIGHGILVFPGGVGTAEEILYLLGLLLHPDNEDMILPLVFTGPESAGPYFQMIDQLIATTLGEVAQEKYQVILNEPAKVAKELSRGMENVRRYRTERSDAYYFNWRLQIEHPFQEPFAGTHEDMSSLELHYEQQPHRLALNLRRAFSGIVGGNVREDVIQQVEEKGPFKLRGDARIVSALDRVLTAFVSQGRMKISADDYKPCYELVA